MVHVSFCVARLFLLPVLLARAETSIGTRYLRGVSGTTSANFSNASARAVDGDTSLSFDQVVGMLEGMTGQLPVFPACSSVLPLVENDVFVEFGHWEKNDQQSFVKYSGPGIKVAFTTNGTVLQSIFQECCGQSMTMEKCMCNTFPKLGVEFPSAGENFGVMVFKGKPSETLGDGTGVETALPVVKPTWANVLTILPAMYEEDFGNAWKTGPCMNGSIPANITEIFSQYTEGCAKYGNGYAGFKAKYPTPTALIGTVYGDNNSCITEFKATQQFKKSGFVNWCENCWPQSSGDMQPFLNDPLKLCIDPATIRAYLETQHFYSEFFGIGMAGTTQPVSPEFIANNTVWPDNVTRKYLPWPAGGARMTKDLEFNIKSSC